MNEDTSKSRFAIVLVIILIIILGSVIYLAAASYQKKWPFSKEPEFCIQVVTTARNPESGEVRVFGTPCDVPEGWLVVPEGNLSEVDELEEIQNENSPGDRTQDGSPGNKVPWIGKDQSGEVCAKVITTARNKLTGEIKDFPTPCEVPEGWEKIYLENLQ